MSSILIERKAIDVSGQLGSLYDVSTDTLISQPSIQATETKPSDESSICRIFSGKQSTAVIDYLQQMDFNEALRQSIFLGLVKTSGVSSFIHYNQPIHGNTRFLYYSYRSKEEKLNIAPEKIDRIVPAPSFRTNATHIITEIVWGFEILCVIQIPNKKSSNTVDSLLHSISKRLKNSYHGFVLTDAEKSQINQLTNVIVYGSETCIKDPNTSLLIILTSLNHWQKHEQFHHSLIYKMCSLAQFYNNKQFPELPNLADQTNFIIKKIQPIITGIDIHTKYLQRLFRTFPDKFASPKLDRESKDFQHQLSSLLDIYAKFRKSSQKVLVNVRQNQCKPTEINDVIADKRYLSLDRTEIVMFSHTAHRWISKAKLIERLNKDQIKYVNVRSHPNRRKTAMTNKRIEIELERFLLQKDGYASVFYSSDRLKNEDAATWNQVYQELISKRQKATQRTTLVYADFTESHYDLKHLTIVELTIQASSKPPRSYLTNDKPSKITDHYENN